MRVLFMYLNCFCFRDFLKAHRLSSIVIALTTSDIKLDDATEFNFVSECLTQFDKTLATLTIQLWKSHKDGGVFLLFLIQQKSNTLYGACDTSLKGEQASHAWVISSGSIDVNKDPMQSIWDHGPVDG